VFSDVNQVFISDIFTSAREPLGDIVAQDLVDVIKKNQSQVFYVGNLDQAVEKIKSLLDSDSVLVTMGAGDVYLVRDKLIKNFTS